MSKSVSQALWGRTPRNVFRLDLTSERFEQLQALWRWAIPLGDVCRINYGAQISNAKGAKVEFGRDRYLGRDATNMGEPKRFYEGSDMRPWGMKWPGIYLDWEPHESFYGPRTLGFFESRKLSVRHISGDHDSFVAWVDEDHYLTDHGVIHCVPYHLLLDAKKYRVTAEQAARSRCYDIYFLLGVVMSRTLLSYYAELYATGSLQGAFSHVYPNTLKELPVPRLDSPLGSPASDWSDRLRAAVGGGRFDRAALRAGFPAREDAAATIAAAARRRQELEASRSEHAVDFMDFMHAHVGDWKWPEGQSLELAPAEEEFLEAVGPKLDSMRLVTAVRDQFRAAVAEANRNLDEVTTLERGIDVLVERVFSLAPPTIV
jgi:hypothetical protein